MKTAYFSADWEHSFHPITPMCVTVLQVSVVDSEEPQYPQNLGIVFYDPAMAQIGPDHYLYDAKRTGMLPEGYVPCRNWDRAEEIVKEFLQQAGCPATQSEVYVDRAYFPSSFKCLFDGETHAAAPAMCIKPTLRERIRDLYYRACSFLV